MDFIAILKKIGHGAETTGKDALGVIVPAISVAADIDPALTPLSALLSGIAHQVLSAANQSASGADKKSAVLTSVEALTPILTELLLAKLGHGVTDTARFQAGVDGAIEAILDISKSFNAVASVTQIGNTTISISPA